MFYKNLQRIEERNVLDVFQVEIKNINNSIFLFSEPTMTEERARR